MKLVLVLCTGNSCRSIMAEALINHHLGERWQAFSAGSNPTGQVHPEALRTLRRRGIEVGQPCSQSWDRFTGQHFDRVVTVCDAAAAETCPVFAGPVERLHWSIPDPATVRGDEATIRAAFDEAFARIQCGIARDFIDQNLHGRD
jgi:arsenate reductase